MRFQIFAAFLLVFIFGTQNVFMFLLPGNPGIIGTALKPKCNKYIGKVECENGRQILPTAKVSLMEFKRTGMYAVISKERITHNGSYLIVGCIEDGHSDHLYLKFKDACYRGQEFIPVQKPNVFKTHRLGGEMSNNSTYDATKHDHDSNSSMPHFRRRLKYPPQPRPRHPRQHRKMENGTGVESNRGRIGTAEIGTRVESNPDAVNCHVNAFGENEILSEQSNCKACGYHFEICEVEGKEVTKVGRLCLNESFINYENDEGPQSLDEPGDCIFFTKNGCENSLYICVDDRCNEKCGNSPFPSLSRPSETSSFSASTNPSTLSPSTTTTSTEFTSTAPSTTTTSEVNGGSLTVNLFSVFGLITISFFILY